MRNYYSLLKQKAITTYLFSALSLTLSNVYATEDETGKGQNASSQVFLANSDAQISTQSETEVEVAPNLDLKDVVEEPLMPAMDKTKKKDTTDSTEANSSKTNNQAATEQDKTSATDTSATKAPEKTSNIDLSDPIEAPKTAKDKNVVDTGTPDKKGTTEAVNIEPEQVHTETPDDVATDLIILGSEVKPNTATRLAWTPSTDISGLTVPTPVLVINGMHSGPTLCLAAAVHGDELNGIEIVRRVMYNLEPDQLHGKIIGIPIVNLQGFQRSSRYLPDRRDLNRFFPGDSTGSLASRIAHSLFNEVIRHCDLLIDLHTGSMRRTNLPQIRANMSEPNVATMVQDFDNTLVVHSPGSPGMLRTAANEAGITSITLEVGESMRIQEDQIKSGTYSINSYMDRISMYPRLFTWGKAQPAYYESQWIRVQNGGILFSDSKLGDFVTPGQILGKVTDPITNKVADIQSPVNGRIIGMAVDQVVMPGFAAYHIGIRATEDELIEKGNDLSDTADLPEEDSPE